MASIFSKIIAGEIPGSFVFRDDLWVGLLDLFPVTPGHLLLIPRQEVALLGELDGATQAAMGPNLARSSRCLHTALDCEGVSVLIRDGAAAGQEVAHLHIHLIPRASGDDPHRFSPGRYAPDDAAANAAMEQMAARLSAAWEQS
ncbi:MAG: HIT family protein [Planctomycetota bacterium]